MVGRSAPAGRPMRHMVFGGWLEPLVRGAPGKVHLGLRDEMCGMARAVLCLEDRCLLLATSIAIVFRVVGCLRQPAPGLTWLHDLAAGSTAIGALTPGIIFMLRLLNRRTRMLSG